MVGMLVFMMVELELGEVQSGFRAEVGDVGDDVNDVVIVGGVWARV